MDNTFTNADVKLPTSIDKVYTEYESFGTISGTVTLTIADKTYVIAKDGSITAQ
ncbi:MAG: hypothetical protein JO154_01380 [Chitinophaga sp.]|uniref:hypothetical protein n=1 Tax=Chitinophaga sp. TaxID=1869181 RepID=UPI0025BAC945|nr:hypothetical protein [Chitinophaga sp.]MBV8251229.1 hypothetical protein [Chitinophaga sp.]